MNTTDSRRSEIARYQRDITATLQAMPLSEDEIAGTRILSAAISSSPEAWRLIRDLLEQVEADKNLIQTIGSRRCLWNPIRLQKWLRRMVDHFGDILLRDDPLDYLLVSGVEIIDGLDHYGFEPTVEQERKLIFATFAFDPDVFKTRIATDCRTLERENSVYTVLYESEIIRLVLNADWDALHHAYMLAQNKQLLSVTHLKELLRTGASRSLAAGVL